MREVACDLCAFACMSVPDAEHASFPEGALINPEGAE